MQNKFEVSRAFDSLRLDIEVDYKDGEDYKILLMADRHWDNPGTDQTMIKRHLDKAKSINAPILDVGDFYCAMQGKYDRRSSKSSIRPEHLAGDYLDSLVNTGVDFLLPYKDQLAWMCPGNHELSIKDRYETDLTERTIALLRASGSNVHRHKYSGFTQVRLKPSSAGTGYVTKVLWHTHGYGGGGPVTKDVIQAARQGNYLNGVDVVISGHTHDQWVMSHPQRGIKGSGKIVESERTHIKIPSAKQKWASESWEDLKGMPPKNVGSAWLIFKYNSSINDFTTHVDFEK